MYSMNYIGKFISNFRDFYNEINAATLTGAIDVIVVEQDDGSFTCSPFHVRFGKLGVLRSREKVVDIEINGEPRQIHMKLGDSGEAFFVEEVSSHGLENGTEIPPHLACSPIPDDNCFPPPRFHLLSDLPQEQHEKILRDSVLSIEREKLEQMSSLPVDQREKFLIEQFSDLPAEHREKWLQIASMTYEERSKIFEESLSAMSTRQKQQMIRDEYSALKIEDRERLFKENFPELPAEQRPKFEKALLNDWRRKEDDDEDEEKWKEHNEISSQAEEEIFNMDNINEDEVKPVSTPKSFVAVTSSERIRKISVVNNDFRPITDDSSNNVREKISCDESSKVDKKSHVDEIVDEVKVQSSSSSKRKRRKKSIMKKKGAQRKASNGSSSQTEVSETETTQPTEESLSEPVLKSASPIVENETKATEDLPPQSDYHFFSDTEITKNRDSRPCSPVQSDTEFEMRKIEQQREEVKEREDDKSHQQSWRWGELPSPPLETSHALNSATTVIQPNDAEAQRSMLSGMFSFMKKTSRVRHNPESEGIYLSDLNADELDPEVAALYFPSSHRGTTVAKEGKQVDEEDTESGNGPSLPQSPNSVEGAIGGPKSLDSDFEESKQSLFDNNIDISLSLCGGLDIENGPIDESFQQNLLHYDDLCNDTKLYENPNLVVKINGKYYNWTTACPIIMSLVAFHRGLPQHTIENLYAQSGSLPIHQDNKKEIANKTNEARSGYSSWFSWRRSSTQPPKKISETIGQDGHDISVENNQAAESPESAIDIEEVDSPSADQEKNEVEEKQVMLESKNLDENSLNNLEGNLTAQSSVEQTNERPEGEGYSGSEDSDSNPNETQGVRIPDRRRPYYESGEKYRKTLRLTSEQIKSLNLKEGPNEVVFSVTTAYQGTSRCKCHIYRWKWNDKIVISDIDGTITKSDVLGHILPIVGKDWAQSGVAQLFTKIKNNGYKLLYLSARAIGQARGTRQYLKSIKQDDLSLPEGPLLLNPTSLLSAFHREVIEKKPEQFKISCLSDIQALFPEGSNPFYAGYGNRINDVWAYRAVGIPITRIFTINHRGELKHELTQTFQSSYSNMSYIVDHLFPALREASDEFSHFSYWRDPIPELPNLDDLFIENQSTQ